MTDINAAAQHSDPEPDIVVNSVMQEPPTQQRSKLLIFMGFPPNVDVTEKYEHQDQDKDQDKDQDEDQDKDQDQDQDKDQDDDQGEDQDDDQDDDQDEDKKGRQPRWRKVLNRLKSNPEEASICQDSRYPLDDALSIRRKPIPPNVLIRLIRTYPKAFTAQTYEIACANPNTHPKVMRILRAADLTGDIVEERPVLVQLMGYPKHIGDNHYTVESVQPDWDAVRKRLMSHPGEAKIDEDGCFPLFDALWVKSKPVPCDVAKSLIEICPEALTDRAFTLAGNPRHSSDILNFMFSFDQKKKTAEPTFGSSISGDSSYVKVD